MREVISNTSPLQYLYQLDLLDLLPALYGEIVVPYGVIKEIAAGRARSVSLPDPESIPWIRVREVATAALLPLIPDLGAGEREVLALALEGSDALVILDDALARRFAKRLEIALTGTLGLLLKAKQIGRVERIEPLLDQLEALNFRLDPETRAHVLRMARE